MKLRSFLLVAAAPLLLYSCVSSKKFKTAQTDIAKLEDKYKTLQAENDTCGQEKGILTRQKETLEREKALLTARLKELQDQLAYVKENNNQALRQLETLSVISSQQAESIKKSMENLGIKDNYIQTLQQQMAYKDSLNMSLVMNLKGAIGDLSDDDINIKVDKGVVYVDISDKLLFKTGSYNITDRAKTVLGKVAMVLKNQPDLEFMVEGHTDAVPYKGSGLIEDNWDLSVLRSTEVARILTIENGIDPKRIIASGRSEFMPTDEADTQEARAKNRRTEIILSPKLDELFNLVK